MSLLRVTLFGRFRAAYYGFSTQVKMLPSSQLLLAYLLLQPRRLHPRDTVMTVCWGDRPEQEARACLSTALWRLRRELRQEGHNDDFLLTTHTFEVGFNWESAHWVDVEEFESITRQVMGFAPDQLQAHHAQALEKSLSLYQGELLEGLHDDWVLRERERLRMVQLEYLVRLLAFNKLHGNFAAAMEYAQQILQLDPLREEIHCEVMQLYVANGQRALALRQYQICGAVLQQELDILPMESTQQLYAEICAAGQMDGGVTGAVGADVTTPSADVLAHMQQLLKKATDDLESVRRRVERAKQLLHKYRSDSSHNS